VTFPSCALTTHALLAHAIQRRAMTIQRK